MPANTIDGETPPTAIKTPRFAFVIHPLDVRRDVARKYSWARFVPERLLEAALLHAFKPQVVGHAKGIVSDVGTALEGWFIACPLTPKQMLSLPVEVTYERLLRCAEIAQSLGAGILGLGAFTSVMGDGGITVAERSPIAITTGNSYTVASAMEGVRHACGLMGVSMPKSEAAIVGAGGSVGSVCAKLLSENVSKVSLIGRSVEKLLPIAHEIEQTTGKIVRITDNVAVGLQNADIVVAVSSAVEAVIEPSFLKKGAIVCDVARPRDVSKRVTTERPDVFVFEGGVVKVPGKSADLGFDFGFPAQTAYACMSETMLLALESRYESFTLGKNVTVSQVETMAALADKHGFRLDGLRSFEKRVTEEYVHAVRVASGRHK